MCADQHSTFETKSYPGVLAFSVGYRIGLDGDYTLPGLSAMFGLHLNDQDNRSGKLSKGCKVRYASNHSLFWAQIV